MAILSLPLSKIHSLYSGLFSVLLFQSSRMLSQLIAVQQFHCVSLLVLSSFFLTLFNRDIKEALFH